MPGGIGIYQSIAIIYQHTRNIPNLPSDRTQTYICDPNMGNPTKGKPVEGDRTPTRVWHDRRLAQNTHPGLKGVTQDRHACNSGLA